MFSKNSLLIMKHQDPCSKLLFLKISQPLKLGRSTKTVDEYCTCIKIDCIHTQVHERIKFIYQSFIFSKSTRWQKSNINAARKIAIT